ncbi:hypothetical protein H0G86_002400 [Trichoderma simmonsii]|uniref:Uncharacterized protein n=1 Tax=Trichoderma simmonsii TaxID=1491479 RepID=A0A8G0PA37_9HYPO|nr:hypothetical protein H0G86_002400 [Trichoderma simmonsii]
MARCMTWSLSSDDGLVMLLCCTLRRDGVAFGKLVAIGLVTLSISLLFISLYIASPFRLSLLPLPLNRDTHPDPLQTMRIVTSLNDCDDRICICIRAQFSFY